MTILDSIKMIGYGVGYGLPSIPYSNIAPGGVVKPPGRKKRKRKQKIQKLSRRRNRGL